MEAVIPNKILHDFADAIRLADPNDFVRSTADFQSQRDAIRLSLDAMDGQAVFLDAILEQVTSDHGKCFQTFAHLVEFFGYSEDTNKIVGQLWLAILQKLTIAQIEQNLSGFSDLGHSLWTILPAFETVVVSLPLRPPFAANLLTHIAERTANDYANGLFWNAVHRFVEQQCSLAVQVLSVLTKSTDAYGLALASFFMGTLRHLQLPMAEIANLNQLEAVCSQHPTLELRTAVLQSWGTTAWQAGIDDVQLEALFERYVEGGDEQQEILVVISRVAWSRGASAVIKSKAINWLRPRAMDASVSKSKCAVVELVSQRLDKSREVEPIDVDLFCSLFPIPVTDTNTWSSVCPYLVTLIGLDFEHFCSLFFRIVECDASNVLAAFRDAERLDWLATEMAKRDVTPLVTQIVVATTRPARRLGLYLFEELKLDGLSRDVLKAVDTRALQVAFYESQCVLMSGESLSKFFVSLLPWVDLMDADFQDDFYREVFLQCQNWTATVQFGLQEVVPNHPIISRILNETGNHSARLREARESSVAMMAVTGYERAGRISKRRTAEITAHSMEKHSPLLQLCNKVVLLYATVNSSYVDGRLSPASNLHPFSASVEVPAVDFADPEGMTIRRWRASKRIAELQQRNVSGQSNDD